jgi:prepilin-type N-terminal cleavage/methylation domain-containing protein
MRTFIKKNEGFGLLELVVAIGILGVAAGVALSAVSSFRSSGYVNTAVEATIGQIKDARARTLAAVNGASYGIHFTTSTVTLYQGATYSPGNSSNQVYVLPREVEISNIGLTASSTTVRFKRLSGMTDTTGNITFRSKRSGKIKVIRILSSGLYEIQ